MTANLKPYSGGCLCGALRWEADAEPRSMGHCYCADCRKASGSGFIPFMIFDGSALRVTGAARQFTCKAANGNDAVRNFCPICGGLVYGGTIGKDTTFSVYAGSLDDAAVFHPRVVIFARDRAPWAMIPPHLKVFDTTPS